MVAEWLLPLLPAWLGSGGSWFLILNAIVATIAMLSSRARPRSLAPALPRRDAGVTRGTSSAVLQRLRSSSIFSFPSSCFPYLQPDATGSSGAVVSQEAEEASSPKSPSLALAPPPAPEAEEDEVADPDAMSMEDAYALVVAGRHRPESEREEEARRSEVDAKAEEFIRGFKEQRLNSIFNYTQMLKKRALGDSGRPARLPNQL